jgi:hypothetical protein
MSSSEPRELENNGTRALKTTIKALLDNGFKYKGSAHAIFPQPESGTYVAYINDNIKRYNNWQGTDRNDSEIVLIFEPVKHQTEIPQEILLELGYEPHVLSGHGQLVHSSGDSTAIFEKKIEKKIEKKTIGTELVEKTKEDGKKVKVVDTKAVKTQSVLQKSVLTVIVQYDSDFDHQNAKKYYKKVKYDSDTEYQHHDELNLNQELKPNTESDKKTMKKLNTAAHAFMTSVVKEIEGSHTGGKTKRRNKRTTVKNKSLKQPKK